MCHFNTLQFQKAPGMCIKYTTRVFRLEYKNICRSYSCSNDHLNQAVGSNFRAKQIFLYLLKIHLHYKQNQDFLDKHGTLQIGELFVAQRAAYFLNNLAYLVIA